MANEEQAGVSPRTVKIQFINNDGGGFADTIEVREGTTISQLLAEKFPGKSPSQLLIRVNRQSVSSSETLKEGDRVSIVPNKIAGAGTR